MKTKRARRGRAFDRMPSGVVMTNDFSTAKVRTLFGTAKRFRLLFCRRSHFDNECHSECAFFGRVLAVFQRLVAQRLARLSAAFAGKTAAVLAVFWTYSTKSPLLSVESGGRWVILVS